MVCSQKKKQRLFIFFIACVIFINLIYIFINYTIDVEYAVAMSFLPICSVIGGKTFSSAEERSEARAGSGNWGLRKIPGLCNGSTKNLAKIPTATEPIGGFTADRKHLLITQNE